MAEMTPGLRLLALALIVPVFALTSSWVRADTGTCAGGTATILPFTDVSSTNIFFCSIAEAYFSGLTFGTTPTTYSPSASVPREQMAAFITRTMDQSVTRSSRRAALNQYWTPQDTSGVALTTVGVEPVLVQSDGADLWVANHTSDTISRVRGSDGRLLETWTGADGAFGVICAAGRVFISGSPGKLYRIDSSQPAGPVTTLSSALGAAPNGIAYDGQRIWTANFGSPGSVSIVTLNPIAVSTVTTGFTKLIGIIYDGNNIWVTDDTSGSGDKLHRLDSSGSISLSVDVVGAHGHPAFDGMNIWVPGFDSPTVSVVRATGALSGTLIATLTGNGLGFPYAASFDGERILVTNSTGGVSLWKATDLTPIGTFSFGAGTTAVGACSDGLNFWITLQNAGKLARF